MLSALPSTSASPASELVPTAPAAPAGLSANVTLAGEGVCNAADFAGVFALADAPTATVPAKEGASCLPVVADEVTPAPHNPRPQGTAFGGEGPVPRAVRWLKPAVVVPEPAAAGANLPAASAPLAVSAAAVAPAAVEPASPGPLVRARSEEKKADEADPFASAIVAPQILVPPQTHAPAPMSFFSAAPGAPLEAAPELGAAEEQGGAEPPALANQSAHGEIPAYSKYTDAGSRFSPPTSRRDAIAPKGLASDRPAVAPLPQRFVPTPAPTSVVSAEAQPATAAASGQAPAVDPAPASVPFQAASVVPSPAPAPALGSSLRASTEVSALPFADSGYTPATSLAVPANFTISGPANSFVQAAPLTPSPVVSSEASVIPFAGSSYSPAFAFSSASISAPAASVQPRPAPALAPSSIAPAETSPVPFTASDYTPAFVPAQAAVAVPVASVAAAPSSSPSRESSPAPRFSADSPAVPVFVSDPARDVVSSPAAISVQASPVAPSPAPARTPSLGGSADAPVVPFTASGYAPAFVPAQAAASVPVPAASVALASTFARLETGAQPGGVAPAPAAPVAAVFAAPSPAGSPVGLTGNKSEGKNTKQNIDKKVLTETKNEGGTEKAEWRATMQSAVAQAFSAAAVPSAVERVELLPASSFPETPATVASRLVERVAAAAERVESRPAEPVWVRLDLAGEHRVDVKVALRDGRVFADFRTDSAELRTALAQAWDGFVRGREAAGTRWAELVFTASQSVAAPAPATPAPAASFAEGNARTDADSGRQSDRRDPPPAWNESFAPRSAAPRSTPAVASVVPASRPDSSRHLSALA